MLKVERLDATLQAVAWEKVFASLEMSAPVASQASEVVRVIYEVRRGENVEVLAELLMNTIPSSLEIPLLTHVSVVDPDQLVGVVIHPSGAVRTVAASFEVSPSVVSLTPSEYLYLLDPNDSSFDVSPNPQILECQLVVVAISVPE